MQVNVLEAKNQLLRLILSAQAGDEVVCARHAKDAAPLIPADVVQATLEPRSVGCGRWGG